MPTAAEVKWTPVIPYGQSRPILIGQREGFSTWVEVSEGFTVRWIIRKYREARENGSEKLVEEVLTNVSQTDRYWDTRARALGFPGASFAMELAEKMLGGL